MKNQYLACNIPSGVEIFSIELNGLSQGCDTRLGGCTDIKCIYGSILDSFCFRLNINSETGRNLTDIVLSFYTCVVDIERVIAYIRSTIHFPYESDGSVGWGTCRIRDTTSSYEEMIDNSIRYLTIRAAFYNMNSYVEIMFENMGKDDEHISISKRTREYYYSSRMLHNFLKKSVPMIYSIYLILQI